MYVYLAIFGGVSTRFGFVLLYPFFVRGFWSRCPATNSTSWTCDENRKNSVYQESLAHMVRTFLRTYLVQTRHDPIRPRDTIIYIYYSKQSAQARSRGRCEHALHEAARFGNASLLVVIEVEPYSRSGGCLKGGAQCFTRIMTSKICVRASRPT